MTFKTIIALLTLSAVAFSVESANEKTEDMWGDEVWGENWQEEETSPWSVAGFVEVAYGKRLQSDVLFERPETLEEVRGHLELDYTATGFEFSFAGDTWYDGVTEQQEYDIREFVVDISALENTDIKLGRQVITWGTGDLVFLNDLFPKDWESFFAGRDDTYLKASSNSLRVTSYFSAINIDFVWTPVFTADHYIDGERFSFFNPLAGQQVGGQDRVNPVEPKETLSNSELALRLYKNIDGVEYAVYGYRGFDKQPVGLTDDSEPTFHRKDIVGASIRGAVASGLYHTELAYHDAKKDGNGTNPLVSNSQLRWLIGYEREVATRLTLGLQYYLEWTQDYDELLENSPYPQFEVTEKRHLVTTRLTYRSQKDEWIWSLFGFYSPSDKDSYIRPSVSYRFSDEWAFTAGANIFSGRDDHTFFGQFKDASNAYVRVRYNFN
ncbi:hypothetical protein [Kangiella marina]|uniref:Uncharacterized protein n=1 Tax=Kangiella marina TaxID=1079178 RepID=A0ABP8IJJ1_9GAMM